MSVYFNIFFMYLEINKFFSEVFSLNKATFGSLALFHKTCATKVFFVKLRCFCRVYKPEILVFLYPLLALKSRLSMNMSKYL